MVSKTPAFLKVSCGCINQISSCCKEWAVKMAAQAAPTCHIVEGWATHLPSREGGAHGKALHKSSPHLQPPYGTVSCFALPSRAAAAGRACIPMGRHICLPCFCSCLSIFEICKGCIAVRAGKDGTRRWPVVGTLMQECCAQARSQREVSRKLTACRPAAPCGAPWMYGSGGLQAIRGGP